MQEEEYEEGEEYNPREFWYNLPKRHQGEKPIVHSLYHVYYPNLSLIVTKDMEYQIPFNNLSLVAGTMGHICPIHYVSSLMMMRIVQLGESSSG